MSILVRRGYVREYVRLCTEVDRAVAEGKSNHPWKVFSPLRPHAAYVRSGILGSNTRMVKGLIKRLGL